MKKCLKCSRNWVTCDWDTIGWGLILLSKRNIIFLVCAFHLMKSWRDIFSITYVECSAAPHFHILLNLLYFFLRRKGLKSQFVPHFVRKIHPKNDLQCNIFTWDNSTGRLSLMESTVLVRSQQHLVNLETDSSLLPWNRTILFNAQLSENKCAQPDIIQNLHWNKYFLQITCTTMDPSPNTT